MPKKELLRITEDLLKVTHVFQKMVVLLSPEQKTALYRELEKAERVKSDGHF